MPTRRSSWGLRPKFARGAAVVLAARALSWLPLSAARALGAAIGRMAWWLRLPGAGVTASNIALCFPELSPSEVRDLARRSLIQTGCVAAETGFIWHASERALDGAIEAVEGAALLDAARSSAGGAVILAPHFGNWELLGFALGRPLRITFLYDRPKGALLDRALCRARSRWGVKLAAGDLGGLRQLKRALADGAAVGVLPDQTPRPDAAVTVPLFGVPAATMTLVHRLIGPQTLVLLATAQRTQRGFRVRYERVCDAVKSADPRVSAIAMNRAIEAAVRRAPAQYQWEYKRFRSRRPARAAAESQR